MSYTVKKLATLSGTSIRTLHYYHEVGLLKPAFTGTNGYRYYEEEQLLRLQQILFYRELGFELERIKGILDRDDFDKIDALQTHRISLKQDVARTQQLIRTIDRTIEHLKGTKKMKKEELFEGFDSEKQAEYEKQLIDRCGNDMKQVITDCNARVKKWSKDKWKETQDEFESICACLTEHIKEHRLPESAEVQETIGRHYLWLKQFWTPNREAYAGHAQFIVSSELRDAYTKHHTELPEFIAAGITEYANQMLS